MSATIASFLLAAFAAGALIAWFLTKIKSAGAIQEFRQELAAQLTIATNEVAQLQERAARIPEIQAKASNLEVLRDELVNQVADLREVAGSTTADLANERSASAEITEKLSAAVNRQKQLESEFFAASVQLGELRTQLDNERTQTVEKLALLAGARESLTDQFKTLAAEILEEKSIRFTQQNQTNIAQLLGPLKAQLITFQAKVEDVYVKETKDRTALAEQVRQLSDLNQAISADAKNLTSALKGSNKMQGNWGELILQRVLDSSGLRLGEEYDVQESHTREDGSRSQPDVTIHLPGDRHLVVDSKVSLNAFIDCVACEDELSRQAAVKKHIDSVRAHIKGLSGKNYQTLYGLKSLDSVLMFVPIEPAFTLAIANDKELFMDAWQKNIILASPSTLMYLVGTVAHLWRQDAQNKNATAIAKRGAELYDKLSAFVVDLELVGKRISQASDSFEDARVKLSRGKGNVIRQAEMLRELGVKPTKSLPAAILQFDEVGSLAAQISLDSDTPQLGLANSLDEGLQE